jgi:ABC-type Fe3+-hydroxamate transport system substrate-binding protein
MDTTPRPRATHGSARSQGNSVLVVAMALAVFVAAAIAFALCENNRSSEPKDPATPPRTVLDHTAVEHMIEQAGYTASCATTTASTPVVLVRLRFACLADGDQNIVVTILNDNGDYVWAPTS